MNKNIKNEEHYIFRSCGIVIEVEVVEILLNGRCRAKFIKIINCEDCRSQEMIQEVEKIISESFIGEINTSELKDLL